MNETVIAEPDIVGKVRSAWADALDIAVETVPMEVNFFDAGGNSLLLLLLWEQLNGMTERDLRAADLFEHSTVRAQAALLGSEEATGPAKLGGRERGRLLGMARRTQPTESGD
ncbi:acyl carrier protein [Amycolatopsis sp. WAC 01376]|uniref:acyl carrier protein n=1 Tax=Amycolatopsis sp. WAC 01376 TaxID=2203195 RepID=UPI001F192745|nr:acyl carrier protein [Amycolatopsis sp. WAC 01376]